MSWMVGSGNSARDVPKATNSLGSASRAQPLPSLLTATTSSLGHREPLTGRVSASQGGKEGTKTFSYPRGWHRGSTRPSMTTSFWNLGALPSPAPAPSPHLRLHLHLHVACIHTHTHTREQGHLLSLACPGIAPHAGRGPPMHSGGLHAPAQHPHLITAIPVSARCRWLS